MITAACVLQFAITLYQTTRCGTKDDPIDMRRHNLARQNIGLYTMYSVTTRVAEMFLNTNFTPIMDFSSMGSMVCRENGC